MKDCPNCSLYGSTGAIWCSSCCRVNGDPDPDCWICSGQGHNTCWVCDGRGELTDEEEERIRPRIQTDNYITFVLPEKEQG